MNVTCMMVSKPGREALAKRAIADFRRQTYAHADLIILTTSEASYEALHAYTADRPAEMVWATAEAPLGALRNLLLEYAYGPVVCQWDDDDRHHPQRIEAQLRHMEASGRHSCFLTSQLYYFPDDNPPFLHVVDWTLAPTKGSGVLIPGTLMCRKSEVRYDDSLRVGEDTRFLQAEIKAHGPAATVDRPGLYARGWHHTRQPAGNATGHAKAMCNVRDRGWRRKKILERIDELRADVRALALPHEQIQLRVANENVHLSLVGDRGPTVSLP